VSSVSTVVVRWSAVRPASCFRRAQDSRIEVNIIDRGSGPPLVLIPGLQGRWEYLRPAVDALASCFRVLTFSLEGDDLDGYAEQVGSALSEKGIERATICGVSFGGLIAVRFAAQYPARCGALVLASTPQPALRLRRRHQMYLRAPWIFGPVFLAESPLRLRPEICAAIPEARARRCFAMRGLRTLFSAPLSLTRMAARARLITSMDARPDCERITAPTLIITGERGLDHVVPVEGSSEYARRIPNARVVVLERTGHLGTITRPEAFTEVVREFINGSVLLPAFAPAVSGRATAEPGRSAPREGRQPDRVA
jgi:3-oxoadipate enol-lactonase